MNIKVKRGITILEVLIAISIMTMFSTLKFIEIKKDSEKILSENIASQLKQIAGATNAFINLKYKDIIEGKTDNSYDMSCPNSSTCKIKISTLENEKLLPNNYSQKNIFGSTYDIILKKEGNAPNYMINGVVLLNDSLKIKKGQSTPNKVINGMALQKIGMDGAVSDDKGDLNGYYGSWKRKLSDFGIANKEGLLAVNVGYSSNMYSIYLRRDGSLPMTGNLNLGGNDINNIKDITMSGNLEVGNNVALKGQLDVNKDAYINGNMMVNGNINGKKDINAEGWVTAKNGHGDKISIGGDAATGAADDFEIRVSKNKPITFFSTESADLDADRIRVRGSISVDGNIKSGKDITSKGIIVANGNIETKANVIAKRGDINELMLNRIAIEGGLCDENGLQARTKDGGILSCNSGKWQQPSSEAVVGIFVNTDGRRGYRKCKVPNLATGDCSCSTKNGYVSFVIDKDETCSGSNDSSCHTTYTYMNMCR